MKVKTLLVTLFVVIALMSGSLSAQDGTVADALAAEGNYELFLALTMVSGVDLTADDIVVYAPSDEVLGAVPEVVVAYLQNNLEAMAEVVNYHVANDGLTVTETTVDQANIIGEVMASNGTAYLIDSVLVPPIELPSIEPAFVSGDIVTAGSSTVGPLSEKIQELFVAAGYADAINNSIIGSGAGFERFCEAGETDISNASRPIKDSEVEACGQLDPARFPVEFRVGTDALAVTVNPGNDWVDDATLEELALIFSTATTWADVREGWPEEEIIRFIPGTDSGTFDYFVEEVFDKDEEPILAAANTQLNEDDNILLEGVANNVNAIGFFGYAYYKNNQDSLKLLSIEGVEATQENVDAAAYPLARPLFIYSDAGIVAEKPQVGEFIVYYMANVNDVIEEVGYFPANPFELNAAKLAALAMVNQ